MKHYKLSELLNNPTASKSVTRKWIEINYFCQQEYKF